MRQAGGWGAAAGSSLLGLLLLVLAIPRLASAFYLLPGEEALQLVEQGSRPGDAGLLRAIDAQAAALDIMPRGEVHMDTAYLAQALAESTSVRSGPSWSGWRAGTLVRHSRWRPAIRVAG